MSQNTPQTDPGLVFCEESWASYYKDVQDLWAKHYDELCADKDRRPMSPDLRFYTAIESAGALQVVCARAHGLLVGYQIAVIRPHPHYSTILCGFEDSFFLDRAYRKGLAGARLIRASEAAMRRRGVELAIFTSNENVPGVKRLFDWLGYRRSHVVHSKWL